MKHVFIKLCNSPGHLTIARRHPEPRRHPERSEGSPAENTRSLAALGMTWWGVTKLLGTILCLCWAAQNVIAGTQPTSLRVTNHCSKTIWVQQNFKEPTGSCKTGTVICKAHTPEYIPDPIVVEIPSNGHFDYQIPNGGLLGTRFWAKQGCDASGYHCKLGESTQTPESPKDFTHYAPPIDSKFEATFGCAKAVFEKNNKDCTVNTSSATREPLDTNTWWNASVVDGYTLPFVIQVKNDNGQCLPGMGSGPLLNPSVDCSGLDISKCPTTENLTTPGQASVVNGISLSSVNLKWIVDGVPVGCFSPCAKLTSGHGNPNTLTAQAPTNWNKQACPWPPGGLANILGNIAAEPPLVLKPSAPLAVGYCCESSVEACAAANLAANTQYAKSVHEEQHCSAYTYAYDDGIGLIQCPSQTQFELIFCPTANDKPLSAHDSTQAIVMFPPDTKAIVTLEGQVIKNNQSVLVYTGSTFALKNALGATCTLSVTPEKVIRTQAGILCSYITINENSIVFKALPDSMGFQFQLGIPTGQTIGPIVATLNNIPITDGQILSSGLFSNPISLTAQQNAISSLCTLTATESNFILGSEPLCQMIVLNPLPGQSILQINLPAKIPDNNLPASPIAPPTPTPTSTPVTGVNAIEFGVPAGIIAKFNQQEVFNGVPVTLENTSNHLSLQQNNNIVRCTLEWKNNAISILKTTAEPCVEGLVIEKTSSDEFYIGIPSILPTSSVPPASSDPIQPPSSSSNTTLDLSCSIGLAQGQSATINGKIIRWDASNKTLVLPPGKTTVSVSSASGQTRNCIITNTNGQLTWDTTAQACVGVVFNGGVLYFPAF